MTRAVVLFRKINANLLEVSDTVSESHGVKQNISNIIFLSIVIIKHAEKASARKEKM